MNYPFWDVGIGYGVLMAVIAVVHVFVSHFAIGGGLYLVLVEISARRHNDARRLTYLRSLSKFFVLVSVVFGALTGVGIWFIIGLLNPAATEVLIHNFVWGWAIEWTFFVIEIAAAIIYFYGWKTMSARNHVVVGWIYFIAAWLSLVVIDGIISFMLTPGRWLETGSFWHGFLNPTYFSSLVFRTGLCITLAGVYAMLVASRERDRDFRGRLVRDNALWILAGVAVMVPSWFWFLGAIPDDLMAAAVERMRTPFTAIDAALWFLGALTAVTVVFGLLIPKRMTTAVAVVMMALGLGFFGGFEWMRESIRKPYVIYGFMYGNATEVSMADSYRSDGLLPHIAFRTGDDGADLFRRACRSCHTIDGYKPLAPVFNGTDPEFIAGIVMGTELLHGNMPPFLGTEEEARMIADHIWERVDQRPFEEIHGLAGAALGRQVYEVRCGRCHVIGGYRENLDSVTGLDDADYNDIFDNGEDYGEGMPDFTGSDAERAALIAWFKSLPEGGAE
ncbi:MAG: c-type cytochrome [Candidatus Krumholzibacteria bacterium]|nr:c-type cytochrome [Candidatus Krumholzibacteria bacterium]MDH4335923.1 c-type cytochrome [Candidatus Krumholzibacteria bacterium]MDH5268501.1 c-type cytochrome [Candidatus Krumholzibacteria bacterium]MDH5628088.1 c-type cytochrome [Candidatus Krumholzibacteria bacterium]